MINESVYVNKWYSKVHLKKIRNTYKSNMDIDPLHKYDFSLLPSHVIATILKYLNYHEQLRAGLTCKNWYFATYEPIIVREVCISISSNLNYSVEEVNRPFGKLALHSIDFNNFDFNIFLSKFGHHISHIYFNGCHISINQLFECLAHLTNLSTLNIKPAKDTFRSPYDIREEIAVVKSNLRGLKHLSLKCTCDTLISDGGGLQFLMSMMPNLEKVSFYPNPYFGLCGVKTLCNYFERQETFLHLRELEIGDFEVIIPQIFEVTTTEFFKIFCGIRQPLNLYKLKFGRISTRLANKENDFDEFCKKMSSVRILTVSTIDQREIVSIVHHMTKLTELNLWEQGITDCRIIGKLRQLEKLHLIVRALQIGPFNFNEELLPDLFTQLNNLKSLCIRQCSLSSRVLNSICNNSKKLTRLVLRHLETNNLQPIYTNLVKLKFLELWFPANKSSSCQVKGDCDITNLKLLEVLKIPRFAPGMTLELIQKLPNLHLSSLEKILSIEILDPNAE